MPRLAIVGLGPSDASLLTLGALERLQAAARVAACGAAPALSTFLAAHGVRLVSPTPFDSAALLRGQAQAVRDAVGFAAAGDAAVGIAGHPVLDFPGLGHLLQALDGADIEAELVAGVPREALAAAAAAPLLPLPAVAIHHSWQELVGIMARLRVCCPWDREQTHSTLLPYLIEEAHEVIEAVDAGDPAKLCEELGDLLLQVVFHSQIAVERGAFSAADVIDALSQKMIRRHPHVFGDADIATTQDQMKSWELIKTQELSIRDRKSLLDGIPKSLPSLLGAQRMQEKAASVGFDWPQPREILVKLDEELAELRAALDAGDSRQARDELGDVLFTIVNLARRLGFDADAAMRAANAKFRGRFAAMETLAGGGATALAESTAEHLEELWRSAKSHEARQVS
ncbi:MAG: nucleoside triphosphate pyrophosphohydrolase [Candidatus Eremiobacteraeota bacterium]|nr:nucleoside triphosphate pyrophosphohydrolase [Candidatus Eremiobacteraeota bacterium]